MQILEQQVSKIDPQKYILFIDNRKDMRIVKLSEMKGFRWRKISIQLKNITQYEYYERIQVNNGTLKKCQLQQSEQQQGQQDQQDQINDNRQIYTLKQAQKLTQQEISKKKKTDKPQELISEIIKSNQQFDKRTQYSKNKYIEKKQKKYLFYFHVQPMTLANIHNYYFKNQPKCVGNIRWDMLAFMRLHGSPYRKVLIAEKTKGLLLASTLIQNAQQITMLTTQQSSLKKYPIVQQLNIPQQQANKTKFIQWTKINQLSNNSYTNLLMLGNYNFKQIIISLQEKLKNNAIIVLYCMYLQPLSQCIEQLRKRKFVNVRLYDAWMREYQVLKNRTHPLMYMDSHPGYIVTAIKVQ